VFILALITGFSEIDMYSMKISDELFDLEYSGYFTLPCCHAIQLPTNEMLHGRTSSQLSTVELYSLKST